MKKTKINLSADTIVQLNAGTHEGVRDGGKLFVLLSEEEGDFDSPEPEAKKEVKTDPVKTQEEPKKAEAKKEEPKATVEASENSEDWSEDDMMAMDTQVLLDECSVLGINPEDTKGRNTNKKLRDLILDFHANGGSVADDTKTVQKQEQEEAEAPAPRTRARREAPKKQPKLEVIPEDEYDTLKEKDLILCKLNIEGADGEKIWEAEVTSYKKPEGGKSEKLHVLFLEDETEDYLREGDIAYEYVDLKI